MDVEVAKISSKGQLVLPLSMRRSLKLGQGDKVILVEEKGKVVIQAVKNMSEAEFEDELHMLKRAAAGWTDIEKGRYKSMSESEFKKELRS